MTAQLHPDTVQTVTKIVIILTHGVDAIVVGYYRGDDLIYVARVRNGFVPASRRQIFARLKPLIISKCPFANLPETHKGRWGEGLTAADMEKCATPLLRSYNRPRFNAVGVGEGEGHFFVGRLTLPRCLVQFELYLVVA